MSEEHVNNLGRALDYMRDERRSAVKALATGAQANEHQRGTTDSNMERLIKYQSVIDALVKAIDDEQQLLKPSQTTCSTPVKKLFLGSREGLSVGSTQ
jgi:hypothetical protein